MANPKGSIYLRISCGECKDPDALGEIKTSESWEQHYEYTTSYTKVMIVCSCGNEQVIDERIDYD